jgi:hypothetical protein
VKLRTWKVLVPATDGARLRPDCIARLEAWLDDLREWELAIAHEEAGVLLGKRHDDLTVLGIERTQGR